MVLKNSSTSVELSDVCRDLTKIELTTETTCQIVPMVTVLINHAKLNYENQLYAGTECRVIQRLFEIMQFNRLSPELVKLCIDAVVYLCRREVLNKSTACTENLTQCFSEIPRLCDVLNAWVAHEDIVFACCSLMMVLAADSEQRQQEFSRMGATKTIVEVLEAYQGNNAVIEMSCRVVRNFSANDEVAAKLIEDGVGKQLQCILSHGSDAAVLDAALWAVVNLSYDEDVAALLGADGCVAGVIHAHQRLQEGGNLLSTLDSSVLWAVRNLSCPSLNLGIFASCGACAVLAGCIERARVSRDLDLLQSAVWCVNNFTCSNALRIQLHSLGLAETVVSVCREELLERTEDSKFGPLAEATVFALRGLAAPAVTTENNAEVSDTDIAISGEHNQTMMGSLGACELLCAILKRFSNREGMVESCCATIVALCRDHSRNKERLGSAGVFAAVLSAIAQHRAVLETVEIGLKVLVACTADHPANTERLVSLGGVSLVVEYMRLHRTDYDVCTLSCELLLTLHYVSEAARAGLAAANQLDSEGRHARPAGRFEDIAAAWEIEELAGVQSQDESKSTGDTSGQ